MPDNTGEQFLHQRTPALHTSQPVEHEQRRRKMAGEKTSPKPHDKLADWMRVLERTHLGNRDDPRVIQRIKDYYHKTYVIKPEDIPDSYFETQRRLAREQGFGDVEINEEQRQQLAEVLITDQQSTLNNWLDYFLSEYSDTFPTWAKYWAFTGMVKLSTFDKEKHVFGKRDKQTVAPFADLDREALGYVIDIIVKTANKEKITQHEADPKFQQLLKEASFGKLYAWAIEKVTPAKENELLTTKGEWVKYLKGSDHMALVNSLQGHGTGWCTAGESTAKLQLQGGDFYVYYSYDKDAKPTIPRAAIRMQGNSIAEVRGIAHQQNLDPYIGEVVDQKLAEFPDGQKYKKKSSDMKRLTEIDKRYKLQQELTKDDLRFLYQLDTKIEGFGNKEDPRIKELLTGRDVKSDISLVTGYSRDEISTTKEEALKGNIKFHYGNLYLNKLKSAKGLTLPETVNGNLYLSGLQSAEGLVLPQTLNGGLYLDQLLSAEGLIMPQTVNGNLYLDHLRSAEGLTLPKTLNGNLSLTNLQSAEGLIMPQTVNGWLALGNLQSAEGLVLPQTLNGGLYLDSLKSAEKDALRLKYPNLDII
jgi:hypothetical protein